MTGVSRYEGHWKASESEGSDLPWPVSQPDWSDKGKFLTALAETESKAERVVYRGLSHCRLCGRVNGHVAFRMNVWEWPEGFKHYLADHDVRPTADFELFILRNS
jgi:hypothetical protein